MAILIRGKPRISEISIEELLGQQEEEPKVEEQEDEENKDEQQG